MPFEEGARVRLKTPVIEGPVIDVAYDKAAKGFTYLVPFTGPDGETHQRWFAEADLEETAPAPAAEQEN